MKNVQGNFEPHPNVNPETGIERPELRGSARLVNIGDRIFELVGKKKTTNYKLGTVVFFEGDEEFKSSAIIYEKVYNAVEKGDEVTIVMHEYEGRDYVSVLGVSFVNALTGFVARKLAQLEASQAVSAEADVVTEQA